MKEIIIKNNPKAPRAIRTASPPDERILLENLVPEYREFIEATGKLALQDAKENIKLKVQEFEKPNNAN
ncbi:MAG: hypothetical protein KAR13_05945 [Desulfobulbaceae bacterium]|nr:hypothetical protein [Desulfobulbaceae bacterium]